MVVVYIVSFSLLCKYVYLFPCSFCVCNGATNILLMDCTFVYYSFLASFTQSAIDFLWGNSIFAHSVCACYRYDTFS